MVDSRGTPVVIGELIAQGGEGGVFKIPGNPSVVAKLYHQAPSADRIAKLKAMVAGSSPELLRLTCWPTEIVAERHGGPVRGFLMPSAGINKEVHKLYSPKSRSVEFQSVDWGFLIQAAANVARAFAVVHRDGHVIGDVNHSSVMIAQDATVKLIDCDSFQVQANGQRYLCEVAEPLHMPPELQGKALRGVIRTPNHDSFGLAVLVFELLFMGRHPFAGMFLGQGDLALEQKIERFMFAYGPKAQSRQVRQPPNTLALEAVSPEITGMFEVAFADFGATGVRPPAGDWVRALTKLQNSLKRCASDASHAYWNGLPVCPWCEIEAKTGVALFSVAFAPLAAGMGFSMALVWESIQKVTAPTEALAPSVERLPVLPATPEYIEAGRKRKALIALGVVCSIPAAIWIALSSQAFFVSFIVGFALFLVPMMIAESSTRAIQSTAKTALDGTKCQVEDLRRQWEATTSINPFLDLKTELEQKKTQYENLPAHRQREVAKLRASLQERQLASYLDGFKIKPGQIPGVGQSRCIMLAAYGIETAADVTYNAVFNVPGFGDATTKKVVAWARNKASGFRFDPTKGIDPKDLRKLDADILAEQRRLEADLMAGGAHLRQIASHIENARTSLIQPIEEALRRLAVAQANVRVLGRI